MEYDDAQFIQIDGLDVLLPIEAKQVTNITITRVIPSADGEWLTIFLRDMTYASAEDAAFDAGRLAVCRKLEGESFFIALAYHEWFDLFDPRFAPKPE